MIEVVLAMSIAVFSVYYVRKAALNVTINVGSERKNEYR